MGGDAPKFQILESFSGIFLQEIEKSLYITESDTP